MSSSRRLPRATPESQGITSRAILRFVDEIEAGGHELHSFMLLRHGRIVAEGWWQPYAPELPHMLFSLTKSFTSTAVGLAIGEGRLSLDETVVSFFPDDLPGEVGDNLAAMRVRHLLSMTTGHATDSMPALETSPDGNWPRAFLARPVEHAPGTHFLYDTGASHILSAIVQRRTGCRLSEYLAPRLFGPLGIRGVMWEEDPRGTNVGGYGLNLGTEDIAAFGQLFLQRGIWQGARLVDEGWIDQATAKQVENGTDSESDWAQGYGFQFWRSRHGAYRGDGAFGQYCLVMPDQDAVLAITAGLPDMQRPLDVVWRTLLPAMASAPLPDEPVAQGELARCLDSLRLAWPEGLDTATAAGLAGGRTYVFEPNELHLATMRFDFVARGCTLTAQDPRGIHTLVIGDRHRPAASRTTLFERPAAVMAAGAWAAEDSYVALARAYLTPFSFSFRITFRGSELALETRPNVGFGPIRPVRLRGRAA